MDVRCESCHTEYELDDASVSDAGTDVQCTFCGHTFTVFRRAAVAAPGPGPSGGESVLETADGRVHRLRDLTVLQKWIIERRVTRSDRLSRDGQNWTRLGALEDLAPFFDVVDEADRARASQSRSSSPDIAAARAQGARPAAAAPVAAGGTVLGHSSPSLPIMPTVTPRGGQKPVTAAGGEPARPRGGERATNRSLELMAVEAPFGATDPETSLVRRPSRGWWKLFVTFGVAGGVAYAGIRALPGMMTPPASSSAAQTGPSSSAVVEPIGQAPAPLPPGDPSAAPGTTAPPTPTEAPAAAAPATEPASPPPAPAAAQPAVARTEPAAAPTPPAEAPPAAKPAERAPRPRPAAPPEAPTYESLVAQADKLLGNGANERALRIYERALALKPGAPDALTGIASAHLDRGRTGPAIEYFNR
ncbi:MAG TPA: zinc-ribbon domain-containing protein, partial [Polyangia bacterium]